MVFFKISRLKYYDGKKIEEYKPKSEIMLHPGLEMCMNRSIDKETHICLISRIASRRQAIIVHRGDEVVEVKDLNSNNGTFINGKKIKANLWMPLKDNDVLSIGLDFYTTELDENNYFFKLVQVNRRCKVFSSNDTKPCDIDCSSVNNTTCPVKKSSIDNKKALEISSNPAIKKPKKEDLKRRKQFSRSEQLEQPPSKKAFIHKTNTPPKKIEEKVTKSKENERKLNNNKSHILSERNRKNSIIIRSPKLKATTHMTNTTSSSSTNKFQTLPKVKSRMSPRKKCTDETNQVKAVIDNILSHRDTDDKPSSYHETLHSTQELHTILDSQVVPDNFPNNESTVDFIFKIPSFSKEKRQSDETKDAPHLEDHISKVLAGENREDDYDLDIGPNSTQDLENILMDSQDLSEKKPNVNNVLHLKKNVTKKFFNNTRSPSKKPKFDCSFEKFYDFGSAKKMTKKNSTGSKTIKIETPLKNISEFPLSNASKRKPEAKINCKSRKKKFSQRQLLPLKKTEESRDISQVVSHVEDSQIMSQYSLTEDDVVEILYDDCNLEGTTNARITTDQTKEIIPEDTEDDGDIGWLQELSQSYDDSCALVIHEEEDEREKDQETDNINLSASNFAFIKQAEDVITFDEEDTAKEDKSEDKIDKSGDKSFEDVQDKIKSKYAVLKKSIEIIEPPIITPGTSRRSKRNSGTKRNSNKPSSTCTNKNASSTSKNTSILYPEVNKTGLSFYCRAVNESPKFIKTRASHSKTTLKTVETKAKLNVRQVNFQSDAEEVHFDFEDASSSVKNSERRSIKLNTNPSLSKLKSMECQFIKNTMSSFHKNDAAVELGDNVHFLCWLCSWLPQQMTMDFPPPVFKGNPIEKLLESKKSYANIAEFYDTIEPLLYYQTWRDMFSQYARDRKPRQISLHRDSVEYIRIQSARKKLFQLKCSIMNASSKWLTERQILLLTFNPVSTITCPSFECFAYVTHIDKHSNATCFNLQITLSVVSEKELTILPTSADINAQVMTKVDINNYRTLSVENHLTSMFLNPENVLEPPLVRMRDKLENVGTCTLGQKHVVSTFLDVCLEKKRKLVLVDALAGTGKTVAMVKAIENLLLYTNPPHTHRILLLGSNVGSLDEASNQLINLRKSLPSQAQKKKLKFLRLDESQNAEVRTYSSKEFVQSELKGFKKEALENPAVLKRTRQEIMNQIASEPNKASPYCLTLEKALKNVEEYPETQVLGKDFLIYFMKTQKRHLIDGADIVCCSLKELCNIESCNYINLNSHRKTTVCIIEDANLCTDLDLSLLLQLHTDKLVLLGDSTVDAILPFPCLYRKNLHWNLFKRLIRAKTVSHKQMIPVVKLNQIHRGTTTLRRNIETVFQHSGSGSMNGEHICSQVDIMEWCLIDHKLEGGAQMTNDSTVRVKSCEMEATLVVNIATQVKNKYPHLSVVVITPFDVQRSILMKILSNKTDEVERLHVSSVLDFMGRQADVVIFSTKLPYDLTSNIMEIVFTRARMSLIIIGNFSSHYTRSSYTSYEWAKVLEISKTSRTLRLVSADFDLKNEKQTLELILKK